MVAKKIVQEGVCLDSSCAMDNVYVSCTNKCLMHDGIQVQSCYMDKAMQVTSI